MLYKEIDNISIYRTRVAFGYFDGLHLGHKAVIDKLIGYEGQAPAVLSFTDKDTLAVYSEKEKEYLLKEDGVQFYFSMPKEQAYSLTAKEFIKDVLVDALHAKSVVCGENIKVGSDNVEIEEFKKLAEEYDIEVDTVSLVSVDGKIVTTDLVKEAISANDFDTMKKYLGYKYILIGEIVHGFAKGRQFGFPTANLQWDANRIFPPHAVYATIARLDGCFFRGMSTIGLRPSADSIPIPSVETWILDFDRDIYGREMLLEVHKKIRDIRKFAGGLAEVRVQLDTDVADVKAFFDSLIDSYKR